MKPDRKPAKSQPVKPKPASKKPLRPMINLSKKNYAILGVGLVTIAAGFISLASGSITLAPILLVLGYCVLIPVGLLVK
ncbi:DUF3098 domain-containing protein [candidate division WOR-3 bacterium]|uniref:DUF3098 domain-containing protein n=1 Tax=candidate division WOR-3 bacterium TaxID=2052148 RepID=A0A937XEL4_UNCW3|nr:DUF3098 domain-containing protein [candidate division WOR-3 bacterium]